MNWKIVFIGGVVFYVALFAVSMITGFVIHSPEGILGAVYKAHNSFWRPELAMDPPDMAAMMKIWVPSGLLSAFLAAGVYSVVRSALAGAPWQRGLKFGVICAVFAFVNMLGYWGVFNLPNQIWAWWAVDYTILYLIAGSVLGWVAHKLAPQG